MAAFVPRAGCLWAGVSVRAKVLAAGISQCSTVPIALLQGYGSQVAIFEISASAMLVGRGRLRPHLSN